MFTCVPLQIFLVIVIKLVILVRNLVYWQVSIEFISSVPVTVSKLLSLLNEAIHIKVMTNADGQHFVCWIGEVFCLVGEGSYTGLYRVVF